MRLIYTMLVVCLAFYAQAQTVVDIIVNSNDHNTLETAVVEAGLVDALNGDGPFTVFAPTDAAFAALDPTVLSDLLDDPTGDLAKILLYHVVGASVPSNSLMDGQTANTLLGQMIEVGVGSDVTINTAVVTVTDIPATNGIVHVIDAVLLPPASTVADVVINSEVHTTLETAVIAAGLAGTLSGDGPFTVFAPTDAAFAAIDPTVLSDLLDDPTGDLEKILRYHVLGAEALSSGLSDGQMARTLLGQMVTVGIDMGDVMIDNAQVTVTDIQTFNGVVHVIDAVMLPPASTVADVVVNSEVHTTLETAVTAAGLAGALSGDGPFTVFAPTDAAFAAIDPTVLSDLLDDPTGDLEKILRYHVLGAEALSSGLSDGQMARTLLGQMVTVGIDMGDVMIDNAQVTVTDIETFNGVVHVIDAVMLPPASTVVDVVVNSEVHTTLETAVTAAGLAGALSGDGPFTVFAPTDAAFAAIDPTVLSDLLDDPTGDLEKILRYHVLGAEALSSGLSDGQMARTLLGQMVTVGIDMGDVMIDNAQVTVTDIETFNGVVHVIDAVMLPPASTVVDVVVNSEIHTTLETAVTAAGLAGALSGDGPFTVFAPTDAAFAALDPTVLSDLLDDPTGDLEKILRYHVLGAEALSSSLSDGQMARTLLGQMVTVGIDMGDVMIDNAQVTVTDIETFNGVVHVIDAVMLPPASTVVDVVVNSEIHTTLETAVTAAELAGTLSGDGPFTLFAPTDAAFAEIDPTVLSALLDDPTGDLANILLYHTVSGTELSSGLSNGQTITTLFDNQSVDVSITAEGTFINDAEVIVVDIETFNGVVHVIDAVLLPELTSVQDLNQINFQVRPNPASSYLDIELPQEMVNKTVIAQLIGLNGAILKNWEINDAIDTVNVSEYPQGTYILFLTTDTDFARSTIVIGK